MPDPSAPLPLRAILSLPVFFWLCTHFLFAAEGSHPLHSQNPIVAKVENREIRLQSLEDKKINDLRKQLYEAVAARMKQSALQQLAKSHPEYDVPTEPVVTDQEIADFYSANKLTSRGTLKELASDIRYYLKRYKMQQLQTGIDKLYQDAVGKGLVTQYLREPNDFLITVPIESGYIRNKTASRAMLLEFSDYQCPACSGVQAVIGQLREKYDKKVLFAYRHFPLSFHTEADEAAIAVECGREQGKFEVLHQYLFSSQQELSKEKSRILDYLKGLGKRLRIGNQKKFAHCVETEKYRDLVDHDVDTGLAIGVSGTPAFVIGRYNPVTKTLKGELMTGGMSLAAFEKYLRKYW